MEKTEKLTGGAQILAKTGIANYILKVESAAPDLLSRKDILQSIQDKCEVVNHGDFNDFADDVISFCKVIESQATDYVDKKGNERFNEYKESNSPEKIRKIREDASTELSKVIKAAQRLEEAE